MAELSQLVKNEIILNQQIENLNLRAATLWKAFVNAFLGQRSKEYKEWVALEETIKSTALTEDARLRLMVRHDLLREQVAPKHSVIVLTALPVLGYWVVKKGLTYFVSSKITTYQTEKQRQKRRLQQAKEKEQRKASKQNIPVAEKVTAAKRRKY